MVNFKKILSKYKIKMSQILVSPMFKNSKWIIIEKLIALALGVTVTALIARYFGPEGYGVFNYALSIVVIYTAISTLGMQTFVVQLTLNNDMDKNEILSTSFILRIIGGVILIFASQFTIFLLEPNDRYLQILTLILSTSMVFKAGEVFEYWLQSNLFAKLSSRVRIFTFLISSILKVVIVITGKTLVTYSFIYVIDAIIISLLLYFTYIKINKSKFKFTFNIRYVKIILSKSWYLIISGLMVTLYMQIDKIMIGTMLSQKNEVGIYAAASNIAQMWYFIPLAFITSYQALVFDKQKSNTDKQRIFIKLYSIILWLGILASFTILFLSPYIVQILYGEQFNRASDILKISVWAGIFATLGSARSLWLVHRNTHHYQLWFAIIGVVLNIGLNLILIPTLQGFGAAVATLFTQFLTVTIIPLFFKETRLSSIMIVKAFVLPFKFDNKR